MSFFDDEAEADLSPSPIRRPRPNQRASSSREGSVSASIGGSSFMDRLRSTVSPQPDPRHRHQSERSRSKASASVYDESSLSNYNGREHEPGSGYGGSLLGDEDEDGGGSGLDMGDGFEGEDEDEEEEDMNDVKKLSKCWVRERGTVELGEWQGDLIDAVFDKLEQQQKMVNTLRSDPQTSEEEHFKLMLVQTEMERVKFLVRSYVRTRLHKIEKYAHYITLTPNMHHLLSGAELSHARRYTELLHTHFQHSVLDSLPEWLRKMDDTYGDGLSMVSKPNRNTPVLIYCKKDCGEITLEGGERAALARGTTHLVKYKLVDRWINLGWAEVL
ncbi:uncharacterized protein I303_106025 [Kwoniella dejecticola CBS 10117]|uniref:DNA replication complex GINS protein SLD5 n=1 Tax=Kwoniella dejecticola CBS 10117 TaxID=1296121 RepID=A0A1A6A132_9TREE|nr:uncharacterized protein I303_06045 [Kwoniella dejecticola CBS 10117]OBR83763.1 hypothetical protein I303_06045 [Kwoniella dejecticola CBS 10117]